MRFNLVASTFVSLIALSGCHDGQITSDDGKSHAEIKIDGNGVSVKSDDGKGAKNEVRLDGAHVDLHDSKGSGLKMDADKEGFSLKVKGDGTSVENNVSINEAELGVPFYPGSEEVKVASLRADTDKEKVSISTRSTSDSPESVIAFYTPKITVDSKSTTVADGKSKIEVKGKLRDGREIGISAHCDSAGAKTELTIATGRKAS